MTDNSKDFYFKNLDGLRAFAALSVIFFHITLWFTFPESFFFDLLKFILSFGGDGGTLGVIFFFMLSGFLITYLMFREQAETGSTDIPFFYYRRILRIWPLYYLTLLVGFFIYPLISLLQGYPHPENASILLYSVFAVNFDHIYHGHPSTGILGVQWSVAVEEQFYLLWPLVFVFFNRKLLFPIFLISIIVLSELFFIKTSVWEIGYYHLISNFRYLAFGALLAYLCYYKTKWVQYILKNMGRTIHLAIYILCLSLILFHQTLSSSFFYFKYLYHLLPFLFFGFVIVEQNFSVNSFFKIGSFHTLTWLGRISYGLYLTHMISITFIRALFPTSSPNYIVLEILLTLALTILISHLSYKYVESFFLSLKDKFPAIKQNLVKYFLTK